ncbi:VOC family protein [Chloroflexota bacterium]
MRHGIILPSLKLEVDKIKIEKIDGVLIMVKDLEKAGKFFSDLLGIEFNPPIENRGQDIRNLVSRPTGIELTSPLTPDGPAARTLAKRGEGLSVLSLKVPNLEEAIAEMKSKGIRHIQSVGKNIAVFHPKDTYGVMIDLIQRE